MNSVPGLQCTGIPPLLEERIDSQELNRPDLQIVTGLIDFHMDPCVGIRPLESSNYAGERDRSIDVEHSSKGVVSDNSFSR